MVYIVVPNDTVTSKLCHTTISLNALLYIALPSGWTGSYTCPALRLYQLGSMRVPECNHKVTGSGYKAVDGCEAVNRRL